jgi:hypothetical protein
MKQSQSALAEEREVALRAFVVDVCAAAVLLVLR